MIYSYRHLHCGVLRHELVVLSHVPYLRQRSDDVLQQCVLCRCQPSRLSCWWYFVSRLHSSCKKINLLQCSGVIVQNCFIAAGAPLGRPMCSAITNMMGPRTVGNGATTPPFLEIYFLLLSFSLKQPLILARTSGRGMPPPGIFS